MESKSYPSHRRDQDSDHPHPRPYSSDYLRNSDASWYPRSHVPRLCSIRAHLPRRGAAFSLVPEAFPQKDGSRYSSTAPRLPAKQFSAPLTRSVPFIAVMRPRASGERRRVVWGRKSGRWHESRPVQGWFTPPHSRIPSRGFVTNMLLTGLEVAGFTVPRPLCRDHGGGYARRRSACCAEWSRRRLAYLWQDSVDAQLDIPW
jgi:hypothetical protein